MIERARLSLKKKVEEVSVTERLHKILASSGVASRRSVEDRISRGEVRVNGEVAQVGAQITAGDRIQIEDKTLVVKAVPGSYGRVLIYNKPDGEVTSRNDPEGRPTVFEKLPKLRGARWISIGRLDINTQGLLIFTSNGELAHKLSHPTQGFRREYVCRIHGEPGDEVLRQLQSGVELEDGPANFDVIEPMDSAGGSNEWYRVEISEGRNREVRRLWEAVGFTVSRLKRTRFGPFSLPKGLHRGELAELSETDVQEVCREVGLPPPPPTLAAEDENARKLRRSRKAPDALLPSGQKRLKAERAYLGYFGGHITGEDKPAGRNERTQRHSPDDRFDPRAAKRRKQQGGKFAPGKGGRPRPGAGRERGPRMALPGHEIQPTFTYDPLTGAFGKVAPAAPGGGGRRGKGGERGGTRGPGGPGDPRGPGGRRHGKPGVVAEPVGVFRSEPSYKPPVYTSFIDPETGEVDGNRTAPVPSGNIAGDLGPRETRLPRPPREPRPPRPPREGGGRPQGQGPRPPNPAAAADPANPNANAGAPGKRRRRFRRRRGGGGAGAGGGSQGANAAPVSASPVPSGGGNGNGGDD